MKLKKSELQARIQAEINEDIHEIETELDHLKDKLEKGIEKFAMPLALYGSLATLPQVIQVLVFRQTAGVSIWTFGLFLLGNIFWFSYGHIRQDKPIMVSHLTTGLLNLVIILGVVIGF